MGIQFRVATEKPWQPAAMETIERIEAGQISWLDSVRLSKPPEPGMMYSTSNAERHGFRVTWQVVGRTHDSDLFVEEGQCWTKIGAGRPIREATTRITKELRGT